jgi:hypothetical protein
MAFWNLVKEAEGEHSLFEWSKARTVLAVVGNRGCCTFVALVRCGMRVGYMSFSSYKGRKSFATDAT